MTPEPKNQKGDAVINGRMPQRGDYLVNRGRVKTQGRVMRVRAAKFEYYKDSDEWFLVEPCKVVWWSNGGGLEVRSLPDPLREDGYEWSDRPLADYTVKWPFPYDNHPEAEPEPISEKAGEAAALWHADRGDMVRAAALFAAVGNDEAADLCKRTAPRWR